MGIFGTCRRPAPWVFLGDWWLMSVKPAALFWYSMLARCFGWLVNTVVTTALWSFPPMLGFLAYGVWPGSQIGAALLLSS